MLALTMQLSRVPALPVSRFPIPHICNVCHAPLADLDYALLGGAFICEDCAEDFASCDDCGLYFPRRSLNDAHDRNGYTCSVCDDCLKESFARCDCCAEYYHYSTITETADGDNVCEDCLADQYFYCDFCEEWHAQSDACAVHDTDGETIYVCESCRDRHFIRCDACGEYYPDDTTARTEDGDDICPDCRDRGDYVYCAHCEDLCHIDNVEYIEEADGYFCRCCAEAYERENGCGAP